MSVVPPLRAPTAGRPRLPAICSPPQRRGGHSAWLRQRERRCAHRHIWIHRRLRLRHSLAIKMAKPRVSHCIQNTSLQLHHHFRSPSAIATPYQRESSVVFLTTAPRQLRIKMPGGATDQSRDYSCMLPAGDDQHRRPWIRHHSRTASGSEVNGIFSSRT
jgi:hypothetical protein